MYFAGERHNNFTVSIGRGFNETEGDLEGFQDCASDLFNASETKILQCDRKIIGQYVRIQLNEMGILSLCKVQVIGKQISGKFRHIYNDKLLTSRC